MLTLTHSPFLKTLGWCLLNSLWQFGILWLVFTIFLHSRKKISPALKHGLALVLMSVGFIWFASGLSYHYFVYSDTLSFVTSANNLSGNTFYPVMYRNIKTFLENNLSYFSILYLLIVAGFFVRFFRFFFYSHTVQIRRLSKVKPELRLYVQKMVQHLNISHKVQVWISEYIDTPMVIGCIKPIILVPIACINQLSTKQLEAILLHELVHIRRNDYLVNLYTSTIEMLFFFNPFARLLVTSIKQEREKSCDDWVLQFRFDPYQYASALLSLEQSRSASYSLAIAAAGENKNLLLQRVERIMGIKKAHPESGFNLIAYFVMIGFLGFIALVNPGNLVVENSEKNISKKIPAPQFNSPFKQFPFNYVVASSPRKTGIIQYSKTTKEIPAANAAVENNDPEEDLLALPVSTDDNKNQMPLQALLQSINNENRDFSIKEKNPELPEVATENEFPFVPNSSFSYYNNTDDSTIIKLKSKLYNEQAVNQSLAQAQKAIEKLDWNRIAKLQKLSKASILQLQKQLQLSLQNLNWSQIYKETMDSVNKEATKNMRSSLKQEYDKMNNYKNLQQQYETIKTELQQQQEKYKNGVEKELNEIEKQVQKKKVIVYI
jgi:beta-lactamase regulating signal transducer with metallopeptidase domain/flavin-binding protein dodecin